MTISPVSTSTPVSVTSTPVTQAATRTPNATTSSLSTSPAVINAVKVPASSGVFGTTQADIQTAVNGINAQIANFNRTDWSVFIKQGATPDQIAKAKQYDMARLLGAEGATMALAGEGGVTGVSFSYAKMDSGASSQDPSPAPPPSTPQLSPAPANATATSSTTASAPPASMASDASTAATTSPAEHTLSSAAIALSVLSASASDAPDAAQKRDIYA
jgi:hypothetical protein